jgi:hypothetical protein
MTKISKNMKGNMKGLELTATTLATFIFVVIVAVVILMLYGSFAAETGAPGSSLFFKLFDFITGFMS